MDKRVVDLTKQLMDEVKKQYDGDQYRAYLKTISSFPQYSWRNTLLIALQRPDARFVLGYKAWEKFDRHVNRGEQGIKILAPCPYRRTVEREKRNADGAQQLQPDGKPMMEIISIQQTAFKIAYVYDISQTSGAEIKSLAYGPKMLDGSVDNYSELMDALTSVSPVPIEYGEISSGAKGYFSPAESKIVIQVGMPEEQTVKTCIHELAHSFLDTEKSDGIDRATRECRALCSAFLNVDCFSFFL